MVWFIQSNSIIVINCGVAMAIGIARQWLGMDIDVLRLYSTSQETQGCQSGTWIKFRHMD